MALRIVEEPLALDQAFDALERSLMAWAGGVTDTWRKEGREGVREEGAAYARRPDMYLYVMMDGDWATLGAALTARDKDLIRLSLRRAAPARDRDRIALAQDETGAFFLLASEAHLRRQSLRDPFTRLAQAPQLKRAVIAAQNYLLIGPLSDPQAPEAVVALAALHPLYERHVDQMGRAAADSDDREEEDLYPISRAITRQHRAHAKAVEGLFEALRARGFEVFGVESGGLTADFAVRRGAEAFVFEIRDGCGAADIAGAIGRLLLVAPAASGVARCALLPAPRTPSEARLAAFDAGLAESQTALFFYDFQDGRARFAPYEAAAGPQTFRRLFGVGPT